MALGQPVTKEFSIGTAELRVGPLSSAGHLTQAHSIGLIDDAVVSVNNEKAILEGMFPRVQVDSVVVKANAKVTATPREYSRRNLGIMLGNGIATAVNDIASTLAADVAVDATSFDVQPGHGANFSVGQVVVLYPDGQPENVSVVEIGNITTDTITVAAGQKVPLAYAEADTIHVYVSHAIPVGNVVKTEYFSCSLVQRNHHSGRPKVFNYWKVSVAGNLEVNTNAEDFASMSMELDCLVPSASEYAAGQPLNHWENKIPTNPLGFFALDNN